MNRTPMIRRLALSTMFWAGCVLCGAALAQQASYPSADAAASAFV